MGDFYKKNYRIINRFLMEIIFFRLKGVQPVLRLTTKDGAIFENSDPISLAFAENSTIASTVLEWIRPPLAQRYMETCAQSKNSKQLTQNWKIIH